jgi:hypothetical protein
LPSFRIYQSLPFHQQEQILSHLEEYLVLGSQVTNSATYKSRKSLDKWLKYAKCMLNGYSIRKSAKLVEINIATSFYWRHKILNCISTFLGIGSVDGVIEADEVFLAESFKGTKPSKCQENLTKEVSTKKVYTTYNILMLYTAI